MIRFLFNFIDFVEGHLKAEMVFNFYRLQNWKKSSVQALSLYRLNLEYFGTILTMTFEPLITLITGPGNCRLIVIILLP